MSRILISGAAGSIGSELVRQLHKNNKLYCFDLNESGLADIMNEFDVPGRVGDVRNSETVRDIYSDFKPEIVYHAAAYKCVDMMEAIPLEAIMTNIIGTYNMIENAKKWECMKKFVFISSDKAVNSNSIMGKTKSVGESLIRNAGKGFISVRFGNVLDSRGSLLPTWRRQHKNGLPLTITDIRMERYFMTIPDAVSLVREASKQKEGLLIMEMGEKRKILDLKTELYGNYPHKIIGIRAGETLSEELMTVEEKKRAIKKGKFYFIK